VKAPIVWALLAIAVLSSPSWAQDPSTDPGGGGQGWSTLSGRTMGSGSTAVLAQAGWPGISATLLHGLREQIDVGGRFAFNYGTDADTQVVPNLRLQGVFRLELADTARYNFGLSVAPGPIFFFPSGFAPQVALGIPLAMTFGIPVGSAVMIHFGLDVPFGVTFGPGWIVQIPLLFGGGVEYFIDRNLAVTFSTRMGPSILATNYGSLGRFGFSLLMGVAFKL
jgi:hypothetical protein